MTTITDPSNTLYLELSTGDVAIELFPEVAPLHVERIKTLTRTGEYDNVAFHRVIEGFVAQTGDVEFGDLEDGYDPALVGRGGSDLPDLPLEPSDIPFERGIVGMARASDPDSANSQFFIMFEEASFLNGQYTVIGEVVTGIGAVDALKRGEGPNGLVSDPDRMVDAEIYADLVAESGVPDFGLGLSVAEAREVALLYEAGLDRNGEIDLPGLNFWIDAREGLLPGQGAPLDRADLSFEFLASPEFEAAYGEALDETDPDYLSDAALVDTLYLNLLDREADAGGRDFWIGALADPNFDRADLLLEFAISNENAAGADLDFLDALAEVDPGEWAFA